MLRFLPLFDYQFTYDELSGLERTQFTSFSEVIEKGVKIDAHPALVQLIIFYLTQVFGYVTWIVKLPFLLFSLGALVYAYVFMFRNFSKQSALFASSVFAFSLIFVFYAPIARMYISGIFFSIALLYYFYEIFFLGNQGKGNYFLFGLFAWLSAINHHINSLFAFTVCASAFLFLNKTNYRAYLLTCALTILAYLPHMRVTLYQLSVPGIGVDVGGWLEVPEITIVFSFLKTLLGTGKTWILILFCALLAVTLRKRFGMGKNQVYLLCLFVFNFLVVYLYTVVRSPIFQYSVMLFSGTAIILFICSFIEFRSRVLFHILLTTTLSLLIYKSYIKKDYLNQSVKTVYEYQFERTIHYKDMYGEENVYPVFFDADNIMKRIYFDKYNRTFGCKISSDSMIANMQNVYFDREKDPVSGGHTPGGKVSSLRLFSEFVAGLKCDYIALSSAMPLHQAIVSAYFPYLLENTQTQANNYKLYSRKKEDKDKEVDGDPVVYYSGIQAPGDFVFGKGAQTFLKTNSLKVDSLNEFPLDAKAALAAVTEKEGQVVLVKTVVKVENKDSPLEVCVSVTDQGTNEQYAYSAKAASDFVMGSDSVSTIFSQHFNGFNYDKVKYKSNLNCYLWNRGREGFELKSMEIIVLDYWPGKWDQWD